MSSSHAAQQNAANWSQGIGPSGPQDTAQKNAQDWATTGYQKANPIPFNPAGASPGMISSHFGGPAEASVVASKIPTKIAEHPDAAKKRALHAMGMAVGPITNAFNQPPPPSGGGYTPDLINGFQGDPFMG
jgi:hypothetical protein